MLFYFRVPLEWLCLLKTPGTDMFSSSERPQMVSPASKDTTEGLQKAAGASKVQAPGEQELLPAGQAQVHTEVGENPGSLLEKGELLVPNLGTWWVDWKWHC